MTSDSDFRYLHPEADRVIISVNPSAGARPGAPLVGRLAELLEQRGFSVQAVGALPELREVVGHDYRCGRLRAVVAAGGDGTVSTVANETEPGVPIMVLPLGTENLLSKYLDIAANPETVCQIIEQGATIRLDAGLAGERVFLLMMGCGFDAEVVRRLHSQRTGHIHHLSYAKPILDSIRSYQYPMLRVFCQAEDHDSPGGPNEGSKTAAGTAAGGTIEPITARWVFVVNLPRYAGGLNIAPDAIGTDGLLDLCTFKEGSLLSGLWYLTGVMLGQHRSWSDCVMLRTRRLRIESDGPVPFQLDGDPGGFLPVDVQVLPKRLTLLVASSWARRTGFCPGD